MNPSTAQARVVVDELIRGGVRDVVLCPGSRNAPLAFALADADRAGRVRLHVRIDERTAGFLALGLASGSGRPVPIAMTSGTAVANLGPAVIEANYARVPLIVLSANRPYELLGTGANQTMEQLGYFGSQVRAAISLGLAEDGAVVQKFVAAGLTFFVSTSFSKSFSLYGERVGALSVLCENKEEAGRVLSQLKIVIRTNYSNPPTHGGAIVAAVLANPELRALWEKELGEMRVRIKAMRQKLVDGLKAAGVKQDMSFITTQIGMFSYSGLTKDQMVRLRNEFGVYGTDTGRMCVAALNSKNIDHVCASIAKVL